MHQKIRKLTETAVMLALLIGLQTITKPLGQIVTGSCVNAVLAITALTIGLSGGIAIAALSPIFAFLLGIAPNFITVVPIMIGNICFATILCLISGQAVKFSWKLPLSVGIAAFAKFSVLYILVVRLICGNLSGLFLGKKLGQIVLLAPPMLKMLPAMFTWPQLITAVIGGILAILIAPVINTRKAS